MKVFKTYIALITSLLFFMCSCRDSAVDDTLTTSEDDMLEFELDFVSRADDEGDNEQDNDDSRKEILENINDYFKDGESTVLLSQRASNLSPSFDENSPNCYKYVYFVNDQANWDEGFNFKSENPISWTRINNSGQLDNGWAFGMLFFPRKLVNQYQIHADQSDKDNFIASDILGAWHRTSTFKDRLRFRLNHLMCKVEVNLYIPLFDEEKNNGYSVDDVKASVINLITDFSINWSGQSSDVLPPTTASDGAKQDIAMYKSEVDEQFILENLSNFGVYQNDELNQDKVKKFSFKVYFPSQPVSGDLLRFVLERGDMKYNYIYRIKNEVNIPLGSGYVTQLELYLPRNDNNVVLLKAKLKDWNNADASFIIMQDEDEEQ